MSYLQNLLYASCYLIVLLTNYIGVHNTRCWIQRVHSWVNTQLSNASGKHSGGIQVSKGSSRSRICQVISWYIDSLSRNKQPFIHMGKIFSSLYNQSGCKPLNLENDLCSGEKYSPLNLYVLCILKLIVLKMKIYTLKALLFYVS